MAEQAAIDALWAALDRPFAREDELGRALARGAEALAQHGWPRAAATAFLWFGSVDRAETLVADEPRDLARCALLRGDRRKAATYFEAAGMLGHAALTLEDQGELAAAHRLWEQLSVSSALRDNVYVRALVRFNVGRLAEALGDAGGSRKATIESIHLLEAAADAFEASGLRERAFDCYQVLLSLGRRGAFENLAEGYLNCIRILRDDHLLHYAMQYYEDFVRLAEGRGELHAVATLYREMAELSSRRGLGYEDHYHRRSARAWERAAEASVAAGEPAEMAENALVAAADTLSRLGAFLSMRAVYEKARALPLPEGRRAKYDRLIRRLEGGLDAPLASRTPPASLHAELAYPQVWRLDVIEWEQGGDAAEAMGEIFLDPKWPDLTRRRALACRIHALAVTEPVSSHHVVLAERLARTEVYAALRPLEVLYGEPGASTAVRSACARALRHLYFKRSFVLLSRALVDAEVEVAREATISLEALHFGHALDPLSRIYRSAADARVRAAALRSIAKIQTAEALESLIEIYTHAPPAEREICKAAFLDAEIGETRAMLKAAATRVGGAVGQELSELANKI